MPCEFIPDPQEVERIIGIKEQNEQILLSFPNVVGVDVGFKYVDGQMTETLAIRVFVNPKVAEGELEPGGQVPGNNVVIPGMIGDVVTDVIQTNVELQVLSLPDFSHWRWTPLIGGISIGPCRSVGGKTYGGTLGAIVRDASHNYYALSNWHVLAVDNTWHVGDKIVQQARIDNGNCPADTVGSLVKGCLAGVYNCGGYSVDAALSSIEHRGGTNYILNIGPVTGTAAPYLGMQVRKNGRTTYLTHGVIDGVALTIAVGYDTIGTVTFHNQISIAPASGTPRFSNKGDSGSVVVNNAVEIVGLLFAGATDGSRSFANVFSDVEAALGITPLINYLWSLGQPINYSDFTPDSIALASYGGKLWAAWKANDSGNRLFISGNSNPLTSWPAGHTINGTDASRKAPSMAEYGGKLYMAWKANDAGNKLYISGTNNPDGPWPNGVTINAGDSSPESPVIASFGGNLYMAWKANDASNKIYISGTNNPLGGAWPGGVAINTVDSTPDALTMVEYGGLLYLAWKANDSSNRIYITATNNPLGTWPSAWAIDTYDSTPVSPALAKYAGEMFIAWKANDPSNRIFFSHTNTPLATWPGGRTINPVDTTPMPPSMAEHAGRLYMAWKANDPSNRIFISPYTP